MRHASLGISLAIAAALGLAAAAEAAEVGAAIAACRAEADDARRLACYDRAAELAKPAGSAAPAPAAAAAAPEDEFGRERQLAYEEDRKREAATRAVGELQSSITGIETRIDGLMTFTLANGQVWRQSRPDSRFSIKEGDEIRIQPASLGSFILSGPGKKSTRVTRVK